MITPSIVGFATLLCILALMGGCATTPVSLTSAGRVLVPASQLPKTVGMPASNHWSPTDEDIRRCEEAIARHLATRRRDLGQYYLRLGGVLREGSRRIEGLAADKQLGNSLLAPPSENRLALPAFGGGEQHFSFEYDADTGKLLKFDFNAPL